mgnify:CR=1 FL=1
MPPKRKLQVTFDDQLHSNVTSSFLVTMNTNRSFIDPDEAQQESIRMRRLVEEIFSNFDDYLIEYTKVKGSNNKIEMKPHPYADVDNPSNVTVSSHAEIGSAMHRLHVHTIVRFQHSPSLAYRVNVNKLRAYLRTQGIAHLDVKFIKDHAASAKAYVYKTRTK